MKGPLGCAKVDAACRWSRESLQLIALPIRAGVRLAIRLHYGYLRSVATDPYLWRGDY